MTIVLAVGAAVTVILLALNASPGEKKIKHEIESLYGVEDPQFLRSMGSGSRSVPRTSTTARSG